MSDLNFVWMSIRDRLTDFPLPDMYIELEQPNLDWYDPDSVDGVFTKYVNNKLLITSYMNGVFLNHGEIELTDLSVLIKALNRLYGLDY